MSERLLPPVELVDLPGAILTALDADDLAAAREAAGLALPAWFVSPHLERMWALRAAQYAADPGVLPWLMGALRDPGAGVVVGAAGFHGPPDEAGMVEVAYEVDPAYRRRGYASAALAALLERAAAAPAVRTVRASIRPDNTPSQGVVKHFGFVAVGEQWDDVDGLETIFELPARS